MFEKALLYLYFRFFLKEPVFRKRGEGGGELKHKKTDGLDRPFF
ncbi:hypothetical protein KIS4809_3667 [Bacillus sp. ZZV12-4809]|nr:hypothetical protein KIS4809_3667 [Bacillus sp. ZZV12-4809]